MIKIVDYQHMHDRLVIIDRRSGVSWWWLELRLMVMTSGD